LEAGESWVYTSSYSIQPDDPDPLDNTGTASGTDPEGDSVTADSNTHSLDLTFNPVLRIDGVWPTVVYVGETWVFTYMISHAPGSDGSPVQNITVSDTLTPSLTRISGDDDDWLELGETWVYTTSYLVQATTPNPLTSTVTLTGQDRDFEAIPPCSEDYSAEVKPFRPIGKVFLPIILRNLTPRGSVR
jgi:hypothetical protein